MSKARITARSFFDVAFKTIIVFVCLVLFLYYSSGKMRKWIEFLPSLFVIIKTITTSTTTTTTTTTAQNSLWRRKNISLFVFVARYSLDNTNHHLSSSFIISIIR